MSGIIGGAGSRSGVIGTTELEFETGLWTPYIGTTSTAYTTTGREGPGYYTKIGDTVTVWGAPGITNPTQGAGYVIISGLPFPSNGYYVSGSIGVVRIGLESALYYFVLNVDETLVTPYYTRSSNTPMPVGAAALNNQTTPFIFFTMTYKTNS